MPAANVDQLWLLFHRFNNQLGIILANAELIEVKASDETIVSSAVDAMATAREIRVQLKRP